ncbi:hypothetical protein H072_5915 [Dactylellina haptotyla CBS 200.50]|uniref:Uncharacterized protein n=1 Tax=Dactylellina haptotyla (strain CBS 200.50) TaxID=1284197 RepID=S8AGK8_DACHA|nr:hypothetical protein H072_5915 [Dactylellina haptotyla CBS 200.50]
MVYGRTTTEILQLNEDSVWYGGPQDRLPKDALRNLPELRRRIREGRQKEAEALVKGAFFAYPSSQRHYEPLGTLYLDFGHEETQIENYRRELDIANSILNVRYNCNGIKYNRDVIASYPDQVIAIQVTSSSRSTFTIRLNRVSERDYETNEFLDSLTARDGMIILHATPGGKNSNRLCCIVSARSDDPEGSIQVLGNTLVINSTKTTILLAAQTTYRVEDPEIAALGDLNKSRQWDELLDYHIKDYRELYDRLWLRLLPNENSDNEPTDLRLKGQPDPLLVALYHNYGRYLLISCSRDGFKALPATLQGIWNPSFQPAWGSKYTININLQMNYWHANIANLPECESPLFDLLERVAKNGERTAREMYGCKGWCAHHNTDIWADTDPQDKWMPATLWPLGGAWLCTHIWERYLFFQDTKFLKRFLPILEGCVRFLLDFLIADETGVFLVSNPSLSPENAFKNSRGEEGVFCEASTMDIQILTSIFQAFISASKQLPEDIATSVSVVETRNALSRLPPQVISQEGLLQEWGRHNYEEVEPGHRHTSHLWGLHPGYSITPNATPELAKAASTVLTRRAAHGGGHTGWSRAWLINLHARLGESDKCKEHVDSLLLKSTLPNMLDDHPPFQIDGNFGGTAGILEMIIQSHELAGGAILIKLLPAWPKEWKGGSIFGVRVRGSASVSFSWKDGEIEKDVVVTSDLATRYCLVFPNGTKKSFQGKGEHRFMYPLFEKVSN